MLLKFPGQNEGPGSGRATVLINAVRWAWNAAGAVISGGGQNVIAASARWAWNVAGAGLGSSLSIAAARWAWDGAGPLLGVSLALSAVRWAWNGAGAGLGQGLAGAAQRWAWNTAGAGLGQGLAGAAQRWAWDTAGADVTQPSGGITYVGSQGFNYQSAPASFSYTVGSGTNRLLVVIIDVFNSSDVLTSITYGGVAMALVDKLAHAGSSYTYLYYLAGAASGANNIVVSLSTSSFITCAAADYAGVNQTTPLQGHSTLDQTAESYTWSLNVTTTANSCWIVTGFNGDNAADLTGTSNCTIRATGPYDDVAIGDSNAAVGVSGTYTVSGGYTGSNFGKQSIIAAAFEPA
jgi:hypothetical protein